MGFAGFYRPVQPAKTSKTPSNLPHGFARTSEGGLDRYRTFSSPARLDNTVTLDAGGVVNGLQRETVSDSVEMLGQEPPDTPRIEAIVEPGIGGKLFDKLPDQPARVVLGQRGEFD